MKKSKGSRCPDCGEVDDYPEGLPAYRDESWTETLHSDPRQCIRFLKQELERVTDRLDSHRL